VGSPKPCGPCDRGAEVEDLDRKAMAKVGLAGKPKERADFVKWGQDRVDRWVAHGDGAGCLAPLGEVLVRSVHSVGQGGAKLGGVSRVCTKEVVGEALREGRPTAVTPVSAGGCRSGDVLGEVGVVECDYRWGITHTKEGPEVGGPLCVDGPRFVLVGMVKELDMAARQDEHGNTIRSRDEVDMASSGWSWEGRED
jgi:hypothetical protein